MDNGNSPQQPSNIHPEMHVRKGPIAIACEGANGISPEGETFRMVRIRIFCATGEHVYDVMADYAIAVAKQMQEAATGLTIAKEIPT